MTKQATIQAPIDPEPRPPAVQLGGDAATEAGRACRHPQTKGRRCGRPPNKLEAMLKVLLPPSRQRKRGHPPDGYRRAGRYSEAVHAIMHEEGVNITTAATLYGERARPQRNPTALLRSIARYWRDYEPDPDDAYDGKMTDV